MTDPILDRVRAWIAGNQLDRNGRLPPERELAETLGLSRVELRRGLAILAEEGLLTRHVGRGTFLTRPQPRRTEPMAELVYRPREVAQTRLVIEPALARLAAWQARADEFAGIQRAADAAAEASSWSSYDLEDGRFHRAIADAAGDRLLLDLFDRLWAASAAIPWGLLGERSGSPEEAGDLRQDHSTIVVCLRGRDASGAAEAMRTHILRQHRRALETPL